MAKLEFQDLEFLDKDTENVEVIFLGCYSAILPKPELEKIGKCRLGKHFIEFQANEKSSNTKFNLLLSKAFFGLRNRLNNRPAVYIHKNSGIPLIGTNEFGIADRDTNWLELKPNTGCNLDCIFCSINESGIKKYDYVVEKDYLVEEACRVIELKKGKVNVHIGPQGEPLLYKDLVQLVGDLRKNPKVNEILCVTNGVLLTKRLIDELSDAGLSRLHISLHTLDKELAAKLAQHPFPVNKIVEIINYAKHKLKVVIVPLIIPGFNEKEIDSLILFAKQIYPEAPLISFQNFLCYPKGKKPVKQRDFKEFFELLEKYEKKYDINLTSNDLGTEFYKDAALEKPFKKNDIVKAVIMLPGRHENEMIAVSGNRCITLVDCRENKEKIGKKVNVKIIRDKHNIFKGTLVN
ncbi:MAG: radical SAM protein [Candidatus Woesearchaeota archaeon]